MGNHHGGAEVFENFLVLIGISIAIVALFQRIRLPSLVGFIITGVVIGPHGLKLIQNDEAISSYAELGVVLLLFSLGIEFSIDKLKELRDYVLRAGGLQVFLTLLICALGAIALKYPIDQAIFIGMVVSLSSTAVGLKLLQQRHEVESSHGRFTVGVLLLQDILVPIFVLLVPILSRLDEANPLQIALNLGLVVVSMLGVFLLARFAVPVLLKWIASAQTAEIPILGSLFLVMLMAYITQRLGLSPALGAFIAGIMISETPYSHQITANISPFRDSFLSLFFISVGLLIDLPFVTANWAEALGWTTLLIGLKWAVVLGVAKFMKRPRRVGIIAGAQLANIGEFSFVLLGVGLIDELIPKTLYQGLLFSSALTIMLNPVLVSLAYAFALRTTSRHGLVQHLPPSRVKGLSDHVVIVGYGMNGRSLANTLRDFKIPYIVIELNGALVRESEKKREPVIYGDAAHAEVLEAAHIHSARVVVFAMSDPVSTRYAVQSARRLNPQVAILARTRYLSELDLLAHAGVTEVISEEFEAFLEINERVLQRYGVEEETREEVSEGCRLRNYGSLRQGIGETLGD
ncbi:MAG: cation:proton antiporter [Fimbriimonadia bacterium]|nr:cation:proton antiporter [Fimbriimonadia bacterium]